MIKRCRHPVKVGCRLCWEDSGRKWQWVDQVKIVGVSVNKQTPHKTPCANIGDPIGYRQCKSCNGNTRLKVFACVARGECTIAKLVDGIPCCRTCTPELGYTPVDGITGTS